MAKYNNFNDIPQQTPSGNWECSYSLKAFIRTIEEWEVDDYYNLEVNPDFQRGHVWDEYKQISYIEAVLSGGAKNSRIIYFNHPSWSTSLDLIDEYDDFVCVDGLQRLTAIRRFVKNEITAFSTYYKDYKGSVRILGNIKINVNDLKTKKEVLNWYVEMNDGGVVHTKEEIDKVKNMINEEG